MHPGSLDPTHIFTRPLDAIGPASDLDVRRRFAVRLRLGGTPLAQVCLRAGLSKPTVIAAHRAYLRDGWAGVDAKSRASRAARVAALARAVLHELLTASPESIAPRAVLWDLALVRDLVGQRSGSRPETDSIQRLLARVGVVGPDPLRAIARERDPIRSAWLRRQWPVIASDAARCGRDILLLGASRLTAPGFAPLDTRYAANDPGVLYARSTRGRMRWLVTTSSNHEDSLVDFVARLLRSTPRPLSLVLPGLPEPLARRVAARLTLAPGQVLLHCIPATSSPVLVDRS